MKYSYVSKSQIKPYMIFWSQLLKEVQKKLRKENKITMEIFLTGSGKYNFITCTNDGIFDLDYNILIHKIPDEYKNNPGKLKDLIRRTIDELRNSDKPTDIKISFGKNSKVPITYIVSKNSQKIMSADIAIHMCNRKTKNISRLVLDKTDGHYSWEEVSYKFQSSEMTENIKLINKNSLSDKLRSGYLKKKEKLSNANSFELLYQTVNEVHDLI